MGKKVIHIIALLVCSSVLVMTYVCWATDMQSDRKSQMEEAKYLTKCVATNWRDRKVTEKLFDQVSDRERETLYMAHRWMTLYERQLDQAEESELQYYKNLGKQLFGSGKNGLCALISFASSPDSRVRGAVALDMAKFSKQEMAIEFVIMFLNDRNAQVRRAAASSLFGFPSERAKEALPFLALRIIKDDKENVQFACARVVEKIIDTEFADGKGNDEATLKAAKKWVRRRYDIPSGF